MHWKTRSIRNADGPASEGEAVLRPDSGMGSTGFGGSSSSGTGYPAAGVPLAMARSGNGWSGSHQDSMSGANAEPPARPAQSGNPAGSADSGAETGPAAQPSDGGGVPEDMATLVLDNPALGAGAVQRPDSVTDPHRAPNYGADESSDAAIMLRVAAGDESGFNYLVEKHYRAMIHFLFRMVRNQAVAEELAQEVFLRVYRSRESYRAEAKFTTWLYRIATNLAVNHARDTKHERAVQTIYLDAPDEETGTTPDVADDEPTAEQHLLREERMAAIRKHVMALPERQRMAVLMHKYQGMDYRQIGEVLKLSESATKSLLFRAYQTLRDKLKDFV
jgi:RNA polymerase sigma-70 factor (ECF subfamily)